MQLFALRMLALVTLLALYKINPVLGIASLSTGWGYVLGQRFRIDGVRR